MMLKFFPLRPHIPTGLRSFRLKYVSIYYINYLRKHLNVFISPSSGIRAHGGVLPPPWTLMFLVPTNGNRASLNDSHTKTLEKKPNKGILLMVLNNGVAQGFYGHGYTGFPWMCV